MPSLHLGEHGGQPRRITYGEGLYLYLQRGSHSFRFLRLRWEVRVGWIPEHADAGYCWNRLFEKLHALAGQPNLATGKSGEVATRSGQTGDPSLSDRVGTQSDANDGDRVRRLFCGRNPAGLQAAIT